MDLIWQHSMESQLGAVVKYHVSYCHSICAALQSFASHLPNVSIEYIVAIVHLDHNTMAQNVV